MKLQQLRYFRVLADIQHYAKAASILSTSQPNLSTSIIQLENELGYKLFDRNGKHVSLNKNGAVFLSFVNQSLNLLDEGVDYIQMCNSKDSNVEIGILPEIATLLGGDLFPKFYDDNPDMKSNLIIKKIVDSSEELFEDLDNLKLDIIFCTKDKIAFKEKVLDMAGVCPSNPSKILNNTILIPLMYQKFVLLVSNNHELAEYKSIRLNQALNYPFIQYKEGSSLRNYVDNLLELTNNRIFDVYDTVDNYELAAGLAASGLGVAIVPDLPYLSSVNAHKISISYPVYSRILYMAIKNSDNHRPTVKKIYKHILNYANENNLISKNFKYKLNI